MPSSTRAVSLARSEHQDDLETLQTLAIFCGVGLVLSLLLAANGWIISMV
jgi:hypothetical protein